MLYVCWGLCWVDGGKGGINAVCMLRCWTVSCMVDGEVGMVKENSEGMVERRSREIVEEGG